LDNGYLAIPSAYISKNPKFQLNIPLKTRIIAPHPYTNQDIVALARGPIVYCLEDSDNTWVDDHFKSLIFDYTAPIEEKLVIDSSMGEPYVVLKAIDAAHFLDLGEITGPITTAGSVRSTQRDGVRELTFVPYALRDNRGGRGHMRVGLRRKQ
jgi:DUF1680 family protein